MGGLRVKVTTAAVDSEGKRREIQRVIILSLRMVKGGCGLIT
jgi:hypothetical protein